MATASCPARKFAVQYLEAHHFSFAAPIGGHRFPVHSVVGRGTLLIGCLNARLLRCWKSSPPQFPGIKRLNGM